MCGHVGVFGKKLEAKHEDAVEDGLFVCALRGRDSVGVGVIPLLTDDNAPSVLKRLGSPPFYLTIPPKGVQALIGHVRSATIGNSNDRDLAHPFQFDNIIGAHNGTLRGPWREVLEDQTNEKFGSDSQGIFYNFAYWGVKETIESIYGAWALVWWDDDEQTLNLLRNSERSLWTARSKSGNLYWASEHWMINAMLRAGEKDRDPLVKTLSPDGKSERFFHKLPIDQWHRFGLNKEGEVELLEVVPLKGAEEPPAPAVKTGWYQRHNVLSPAVAAWERHLSKERVEEQIRKEVAAANRGELFREVAGELYVSKPGSDKGEITFRQFLEFNTDGDCAGCGSCISHPREIGYLADDYSWFACTDCAEDWDFASAYVNGEIANDDDKHWSDVDMFDDELPQDLSDILPAALRKNIDQAKGQKKA